MTTGNTALPPEIIDIIFSFLSSDTASLQACAQVNPLFLGIVERHLYRHISVYNIQATDRGKQTPAQLSKLLHDQPHISIYIQSLRIVLTSPGILQWFMTRSLDDEELASILPLLLHLQKITLSTRKSGRIAWPRLHYRFRFAFLQSAQSSTLEDVVLNGIDDFPISALNDCSSLKRLSFVGIFMINFMEPTSRHSNPQLHSLSIQHCSLALADIVTWATTPSFSPVSRLRSLDFRTLRADDLVWLHRVLEACSDTLTTLELDFGKEFQTHYDLILGTSNSPRPIPPYLTLINIPHLAHLMIHTNIYSSHDFFIPSSGGETQLLRKYTSSLPAIILLLGTLSISSVLKCLVLNIRFRLDFTFMAEIDWTPLGRAATSSRLLSLERIEIRVSMEMNQSQRGKREASSKLIEILRKDTTLTILEGLGLLVIKAEDEC